MFLARILIWIQIGSNSAWIPKNLFRGRPYDTLVGWHVFINMPYLLSDPILPLDVVSTRLLCTSKSHPEYNPIPVGIPSGGQM